MRDVEIDRLVGPGLEPTAEFVNSLRVEMAAAWRGDGSSTGRGRHVHAHRRQRWSLFVAAAVSVAAVVVGVVLLTGRSPQHAVTPAPTPASTPASTRAETTLPTDPVSSIREAVGNDAAPALGGEAIARWTGQQLSALGVETDEVRVGVLDDGTLAGLTNDGSEILLVDGSGSVLERVPVVGTPNQMLIHPDDAVELIGSDGTVTWVSLAAGRRGRPIDPPRVPTVEGAGCSWTVSFEGGPQWVVPEGGCNASVDSALEQPDGSVLLTTRETIGDDEAVEVAAVRLRPDGTISRVVLGRHAVDGAEGWVKYQPTVTGGVVLFHYSDDAVVLYRYRFPSS